MIDATILIPTHDHAATLPVSIRSVLEQRDVSFELFVVGDGVEDDTREVVKRFSDDSRVRFFDRQKGARHGERSRHDALEEASGEIICYLSDDDILFPWHVAEMRRLLSQADFAHSTPVFVGPDGVLVYGPGDLVRSEYVERLREGKGNFISLTGASHTRALYERLPDGWRPAPHDVPTDLYMWRQIFSLPHTRAKTSHLITAMHFPSPSWHDVPDQERAGAIEGWLELGLRPEGKAELQALLEDAIWRTAQDLKLRTFLLREQRDEAMLEVERLRAPIWRKLGRGALRSEPLRSLRDRLR